MSQYQLRFRCETGLTLLADFEQMGDVQVLEGYMSDFRPFFAGLKDNALRRAFLRFKRKAREMRKIEQEFGVGSCLNLENEAVKGLLARGFRRYMPQMIDNAMNQKNSLAA